MFSVHSILNFYHRNQIHQHFVKWHRWWQSQAHPRPRVGINSALSSQSKFVSFDQVYIELLMYFSLAPKRLDHCDAKEHACSRNNYWKEEDQQTTLTVRYPSIFVIHARTFSGRVERRHVQSAPNQYGKDSPFLVQRMHARLCRYAGVKTWHLRMHLG